MIAAIGDASPQQPTTPLEAGSPGQTSLTGQTGQVEDSEQVEQVHREVGSPLATGIEEEGDESSQFPSTQQLFGADSSYVQNYMYPSLYSLYTCNIVEQFICVLLHSYM